MTLSEQAKRVSTREDLAAFVGALVADLQVNGGRWENGDLQRFLEAMAGWIEDMDGYYANMGQDMSRLPPWRLLADVLNAAKSYE